MLQIKRGVCVLSSYGGVNCGRMQWVRERCRIVRKSRSFFSRESVDYPVNSGRNSPDCRGSRLLWNVGICMWLSRWHCRRRISITLTLDVSTVQPSWISFRGIDFDSVCTVFIFRFSWAFTQFYFLFLTLPPTDLDPKYVYRVYLKYMDKPQEWVLPIKIKKIVGIRVWPEMSGFEFDWNTNSTINIGSM
jgi:hypothetical protein